jgi:hypothetical protein
MESRGYRDALAAMLAQFLHGEEISFTAVPLGLEFVRGEGVRREVEQQLEDEKRHHKMFDAERKRLGLPSDSPNEAMSKFYDVVVNRLKHREFIGGVMVGCFMLEGAAFSTLLSHSKVVDAELSATFKEIVSDEARHIALNISVLQDIVADRPENLAKIVEVHREALPMMFELFTSFQAINDEMGIDNEWFTMRCLFHHSQRIRRLHLPNEYAKTMLADTVAVAGSTK